MAKYIGTFFGLSASMNPIASAPFSIFDAVFMLIQLMGEDLFKVSIFLIAMGLIYYFTKNRKNALVFGVFASMIIFGLTHMSAYDNNLYQCIAIIGVGTVFHLYPYLKTKNVFNTYFAHIIIDFGIVTFVKVAMTFASH